MAEKSEDVVVTKEDKVTKAKELYARGSRNYVLRCYNEAADDLSQVCKLYEEVYGQVADQMGMPYLLYAKSLIALAQDENKLMDVPEEEEDGDDPDGDDPDGDDPDGDDPDGDEDTESAPEKTEEEQTAKNKDDSSTKDDIDKDEAKIDEKKNGDDKERENVIDATSTGNGTTAEDEIPSTSNAHVESEVSVDATVDTNEEIEVSVDGTVDTNEEIEDDSAANLQVAWEILELAAKIFRRQGESALTNLAEVYAELAGISFENSNFEAAINDYVKALEIQVKLPEDNRRIIAEIHYKIGLAHLMQNSFDECVKELKVACELIEEEISEEKSKEESEEIAGLIKDLEETKQDIVSKISEVEETKQQSIADVRKELSKLLSIQPQTSTDGAGTSSSTLDTGDSSSVEKPKDISHLIKRKKPDSDNADVSPAKRPTL